MLLNPDYAPGSEVSKQRFSPLDFLNIKLFLFGFDKGYFDIIPGPLF